MSTRCDEMAGRVRETGLLAVGRPVVVLLSGGRDSVCLLDMAVALGAAGSVMAFHVNYGLRPEADDDEAFCRTLCGELGVDLAVTGNGGITHFRSFAEVRNKAQGRINGPSTAPSAISQSGLILDRRHTTMVSPHSSKSVQCVTAPAAITQPAASVKPTASGDRPSRMALTARVSRLPLRQRFA